jgi:hypothetical protein
MEIQQTIMKTARKTRVRRTTLHKEGIKYVLITLTRTMAKATPVVVGLLLLVPMYVYAQTDEEYQEMFTSVIECLDDYESEQEISGERRQECFDAVAQAHQVLINEDLSQYSEETQEIGIQAAERIAPYTSNTPSAGGGTGGSDGNIGGLGNTFTPTEPSDTGVGGSDDSCNYILGVCTGVNPNTGDTYDYSSD